MKPWRRSTYTELGIGAYFSPDAPMDLNPKNDAMTLRGAKLVDWSLNLARAQPLIYSDFS